jgi:calcium/calmodulin-dependent protein kinase I
VTSGALGEYKLPPSSFSHSLADTLDACRTITYVLLSGYSPFRSDKVKALIEETTKGEVEFHEKYWGKVSVEGEYH